MFRLRGSLPISGQGRKDLICRRDPDLRPQVVVPRLDPVLDVAFELREQAMRPHLIFFVVSSANHRSMKLSQLNPGRTKCGRRRASQCLGAGLYACGVVVNEVMNVEVARNLASMHSMKLTNSMARCRLSSEVTVPPSVENAAKSDAMSRWCDRRSRVPARWTGSS